MSPIAQGRYRIIVDQEKADKVTKKVTTDEKRNRVAPSPIHAEKERRNKENSWFNQIGQSARIGTKSTHTLIPVHQPIGCEVKDSEAQEN
jgi:hypothetical protein